MTKIMKKNYDNLKKISHSPKERHPPKDQDDDPKNEKYQEIEGNPKIQMTQTQNLGQPNKIKTSKGCPQKNV